MSFTVLIRAMLRAFLLSWWQKPLVQHAQCWLPRFGLFCTAIWMFGAAVQNYTLIIFGASLVVVVLISAAMILAALPVAIVLHLVQAHVARVEVQAMSGDLSSKAMNRRDFLRTAASALPMISTASGLAGVVKSFDEVRLPVFHFTFAGLPSALHGLKICQLSDMHLGYFRGVREMEKLFEQVVAHQPDLVLVTGDIADDLTLLPETLRLLAALKPPLGVYASLGNHEYYRGIKTVRQHFEASTIPLLCNAGLSLSVPGATLFIGGADDPSRSRRRDMKTFFPQTVAAALLNAPSDSFKILMSHRPRGFYSAAELGAQLTLAGHTHGMQIGYNGRSLFELNSSEKLLWGHYQRGESQLYTTSGVGHWFPFRLGYPPEAPIIVLERS